MLDCISGGRLVAGFPVGTPMDTCYAYGQNPSQLRQRYHEAHDLILKAWTTPEPFTWNGRFNKLRYVNVWPRPLQQPHPPIWIPGGGSVETWRWCAERDYVYSYLSYFGYKLGKATMDGFWQEMTRLGKEPNPYRAGFLQFVGVAEIARGGDGALPRARRVLLRALPARRRRATRRRPATRARRRCARACSRRWCRRRRARRASSSAYGAPALRGDRRAGLRDRRQPRRGGRAAARGRDRADTSASSCCCSSSATWAAQLTLHNTELFAKRVLPQLARSLRRRVGEPLVAAPAAGAAARAAAGADARVSAPARAPRRAAARRRGARAGRRATGAPLCFLGGLRGLPRWPAFLDRARARGAA